MNASFCLTSSFIGSSPIPDTLSGILSVTPVISPFLRWQAYRRLQELNISCTCVTGEPLSIEINNATEGILLWSVIRQVTQSRLEMANWLNMCWQEVSDEVS